MRPPPGRLGCASCGHALIKRGLRGHRSAHRACRYQPRCSTRTGASSNSAGLPRTTSSSRSFCVGPSRIGSTIEVLNPDLAAAVGEPWFQIKGRWIHEMDFDPKPVFQRLQVSALALYARARFMDTTAAA